MLPLLHDLLAAHETAISRCDARVVTVVALALLLACVGARSWHLPAGLALAGLLAVRPLGLPPRLVATRLLAPLLVVAVLVLVGLVLAGTQSLPGSGFLAARVLGASAVLVLLGATLPVHRLAGALRWLRLPLLIVELLLLTYRFVFVLIDRAEAGADALRLRLGWIDRRRRLASAGRLAGLVLLRSLDQSARTAQAMRLRGGPGRLPLAPTVPMTAGAALALGLGVLLTAALWWIAA